MTKKDEKEFCKMLRDYNPNIMFLNTKPSFDCDIDSKLFVDIPEYLDTNFISIVNFDYITKKQLVKRYEKYSEYYHFFDVGYAQMQFLRCRPDIYMKSCLQHGRISDSYDVSDSVEKKWKNKVYNILKKMSKEKIHLLYKNEEGKFIIHHKPATKQIALPDAIKVYNGRNNNYMLHNFGIFVAENTNIEDLKLPKQFPPKMMNK